MEILNPKRFLEEYDQWMMFKDHYDSEMRSQEQMDFINQYQPERSKREDFDKYYGMKAEIKEDGLCYFEDGLIIDPNRPIEDAVL